MLDKSGLRNAYRAASLVTELTVLTVIGVLAGIQLDGWFDASPWLTLLGAAIGFGAGNARFFKAIQELQRSDDDPDEHSS